jgi:hypothetical protein
MHDVAMADIKMDQDQDGRLQWLWLVMWLVSMRLWRRNA